MIKSSALTSLLKKVISNGIETVFISRISGEILCIEGKESNQTLSDIISSMWIEYYQIGEASLKDEKLNASLTCKLQLKDNQESTNIEQNDDSITLNYLFHQD